MNKTTKYIIWVVVIVIAVWAIYAMSNKQGSGPASGEPIKIGVIAPLTGDGAIYGEPLRNITQLATDEINKAGGVNGRPIEMIYEDGKCSGKDGANAMQKLVNVDKVQVVIGGVCSSETLSAEPIGTENKVFLFSAAASSPDLTNKSKFFARDYPSDASQGEVLANVAWNTKKWKKVGFIVEQLDYPQGIYKAFKTKFESLGGTIVEEEFPTGVKDFRSQITKIKGSNVDALFVDTQAPAIAGVILTQVQELKFKTPILLADATASDPATVTKYMDILEGGLAAEFGVNPANPKFKNLLDIYKAKYGVETPYQSYAQTQYDAVYLVRDAIMAVGYDGGKIADWIRNVKDWNGASGKVTIGSDGDRVGGHSPETFKNGKVEKLLNS